ncbi:hypothetical protein LXL04_026003 [Taraxacum kok-saghyz]
MDVMVDNITHLVQSSNASQNTTQAQLEIIMKQLTTQYEQTNTLLATLLKPDQKPSSSHTFPKTEVKFATNDNQPRPPKLTLTPLQA